MEEIKIIDGSGDRDCFTIVPNYILNHSTANDQALYLQMKRYAGEDGKCFATQETLIKQLGIGRKTLLKSLNYLITHRWISFMGITKGKTRPIKTYKINNIWKENTDYYRKNKKIPSERAVSLEDKIPSESEGDTVQKNSKIPSERAVEEEPILIRTINKIATQGVADTNSLIELFKTINPTYEKLYKNKTERSALENLVKKFGREKVEATIKALPNIVNKKYAPTITKPTQLENKLAELIQFVNKEKSGKMNMGVIKV